MLIPAPVLGASTSAWKVCDCQASKSLQMSGVKLCFAAHTISDGRPPRCEQPLL